MTELAPVLLLVLLILRARGSPAEGPSSSLGGPSPPQACAATSASATVTPGGNKRMVRSSVSYSISRSLCSCLSTSFWNDGMPGCSSHRNRSASPTSLVVTDPGAGRGHGFGHELLTTDVVGVL